jgi:hypothetical protein
MSTNQTDPEPDAGTDLTTAADTGRDARTVVETSVPPDHPVHRCDYCDRPFAEASYLALHRGLAHADRVSDAEREAFATAYEVEQAELGRFRLVALGLLVLLYFGFLFVFAFVT